MFTRLHRSLLALAVASCVPAVDADDAAPRVVEAFAIDVDARAEKQLAAVRDQLAADEWDRGVERLLEIRRASAGRLVGLGPRRSTSVERYVDLVLAGLPAEGLDAYRNSVDARIEPVFARGLRDLDETALQRVVREGYVSSFGDEALLLLGDLALERGDFDAAREFWTQLVPLRGEFPVGEPLPRLRYPDAETPEPDVLARLVAVSIVAGDLDRAGRELASLRERHPTALGRIAGREGRYVDLLSARLEAARGEGIDSALDEDAEERVPRRSPAFRFTTFGGVAARSGGRSSPVPVGGPAWSVTLVPPLLPLPVRRPALPERGPPSVFPLVWEDVVLVSSEDRISAFHARSGDPWPDPLDTPVLYRVDRLVSLPRQRVVGVPRFSMTLDDGLLYARLGSPITGIAAKELANLGSEIVCLDLAGAEGRLLARISADRVMDGETGWMFEGAPTVDAVTGRSFVLLRRIAPQTELVAACLELGPVGRRDNRFRVVWRKPIGSALERVEDTRSIVTCLLPATDGRRLYVSTEYGAVVALDANDGALQWATSYPRRPPGEGNVDGQLSDATVVGLLPPVVHGGVVFVSPNDSDDVIAIDAAEGFVRWSRPVPDRLRHLLGVGEGRLIASGDSLWAFDVRTGAIVWAKRRFEPEFRGFGRGQLVGDQVWWPQREGIAVVSQRDGRPANGVPVSHWIDLRPRGVTGGNLLVTPRGLLLAGPDALVGFSGTASRIDRE